MTDDDEELALTLNGKKRKLTRMDFEQAMLGSGLNEKVISNIIDKFRNNYPRWESVIRASFLPEAMQNTYWKFIQNRIAHLLIEK